MSADLFNGILRQHADAQARVSELVTPMTYRGWEIRRGRWPEPDWLAEHPNFDASWEGEEDGWVHNGLQTDAPTYEALCEEIDSIEENRGGSMSDPRWQGCAIPPPGWWCSREAGHEGPCAARAASVDRSGEADETSTKIEGSAEGESK